MNVIAKRDVIASSLFYFTCDKEFETRVISEAFDARAEKELHKFSHKIRLARKIKIYEKLRK